MSGDTTGTVNQLKNRFRDGPHRGCHSEQNKKNHTMLSLVRWQRDNLGSEGGVGMLYTLTLITGLVECLCFSGVVFGWASLVFVLKDGGYFGNLCVEVAGRNGTGPEDTGECKRVKFPNNLCVISTRYRTDRFCTQSIG